ncbi:MAG: electron transfer flavoprotein subunit beta/FixA family protein [Candidatus Bathyarchaeota archaeon]|nr:MAG: electron transfer flavoprotein subunit beta/FixA family protein [Candidatus Bathyarchaeota archaeon]
MPTIIVCLKQALDVAELKVDSTTQRVLTANAPRKISDFDKNALEEAVKLKEKLGGEVITVTVGSEKAKMVLKEALAMGTDRAYLLSDPSFEHSDTLAISYILAEGIKKLGSYDLILCGEASIDSYSGQVGPRLAERLQLPQITYVRALSLNGDTVVAERTLENCYETIKTKTPVLATVTKEINEPRIPSLMAIMKASKKEIITWSAEDLKVAKTRVGIDGSAIQIMNVLAPKMDRKRIVLEADTVKGVAEKLAKALINEGVGGR